MSLPFFPQPKPSGRLKDKTAEKREDEKQLAKMRAAVWKRDQDTCQCCGLVVVKSISLIPNRGEVHHLRGRRVAPEDKFDAAKAVLLCAACHIDVTEKKVILKPRRKL